MVISLAGIEIIGVELWKAWIFTHLGGVITGIAFLAAGRKNHKETGIDSSETEEV